MFTNFIINVLTLLAPQIPQIICNYDIRVYEMLLQHYVLRYIFKQNIIFINTFTSFYELLNKKSLIIQTLKIFNNDDLMKIVDEK